MIKESRSRYPSVKNGFISNQSITLSLTKQAKKEHSTVGSGYLDYVTTWKNMLLIKED